MQIIVDSREQRNGLILEYFSNQGIAFKIKKLSEGDYSMSGFENKVIVERKQSLTELSNNFTKGRMRFEKEFIRAKESGAKVILLIEDEKGRERMLERREKDKDKSLTAEQRQKGTWKSNFSANSMIGSLQKWKERYGFDILFCSRKDSGREILNIFKKYLEEVGTNEF